MENISVRSVQEIDKNWIKELITSQWGSDNIAVHGEVFYPAELPGFLAFIKDEPVGLITYNIQSGVCEIITLNALKPRLGIGSKLIETVKEKAQKTGCRKLWLITTNDNLNALGFYQKRGFHLSALRAGAVALSRQLKPQIPLVGENGIPICDEIELEMDL